MLNEFQQFLQLHFIKICKNMYIPYDQSQNYLRHYGQKYNNTIVLSFVEIVYIFCLKKLGNDIFNVEKIKSILCELRLGELTNIIIYFILKNNGYNIIFNFSSLYLFKKHKNFNRNKDKPIGLFSIVKPTSKVIFQIPYEDQIVCVKQHDTFCFLKLTYNVTLTTQTNSNLYKIK
ncbi:F0F1-type ATP synthase, subunit c/Archaeal/vacuolar-type H+-ATPase, subunit K [Enterocytozoon bieneusi H348]|nr:F0F1-type ATP synthase, subunit c/Archaeal/vacuolar-type H+-ATPase, subunit K [Enterocytozoon bieneusi H348]|eukprot:XP_002649623.1 F0F1-type ATP synthase, subunit c/Archaeal/vacuolar-type H+-ATPase, subunit K [Enterocytozoon bieneusi H348]